MPRRAAPSEQHSSKVPELNDYIRARLPKGEVASFTELERSLGELRSVGDKGHRVLLASVLPRLAQFESLPAALIPQLIQLSSTEDRRLARFTYYLLQLLLGPGCAGTPSPSLGGGVGVRDLPKDIAAKAWQGVDSTTTDPALTELQLRTLAAAARSIEGPLDRDLQAALAVATSRGDQSGGLGFMPTGKKAAQKLQAETWDLQRVIASISRTALSGKGAREAALKSFWGISSPQSVGARHALALAAAAMRQDAVGTLKQEKTLTELIAGATHGYDTSPLSRGVAAAPAKGIAALSAIESHVKIQDKWARISLARLCAAVVYGDWNSTDKFVRGPGAAFWKLLVMIATRDVEPLVAIEGCKALLGALPATAAPLGGVAPADEAGRDARTRTRAWTFASAQAAPEGPAEEVLEGGASLLGVVGARIRFFLLSNNAPLLCSACRAAGAVFEAQARVLGRGSAPAEALAAVRALSDDVAAIAASPAHEAAVRCAAIEALLWTQVPGKSPVLPPEDIITYVSYGSARNGPWPVHLLQPLLTGVAKVLRTAPPAAPSLLAIAAAIACGAPCQETAVQLIDLWSAALAQGTVGKAAALDSARSVLNFGLSLMPDAGLHGEASQRARNRQAQQDVAWLELGKGAAWWLGEYANVATGEFVGNPQSPSRNSQTGDSVETPQFTLPAGSSLDEVALQSGRNVELASVVACLQQAFLLLPWPVRSVAALSLAKVAVRSDEPYRLQCYGFLASLASPGPSGAHDTFGVASVVKAPLATLDSLYSSQTVLQSLAAQYGHMPHKWPPSVLKQLKERAAWLFAAIERSIGSLQGATYHPLGVLSRELLASGLDRLAEAPAPREPLASPFAAQPSNAATVTTAVSVSPPLSPQQSLAAAQSIPATPRSPSLFSAASVDPLSQLVKGLDTRIQADTFPVREPRPWETSFVREPSGEAAKHEHRSSFGGYSDAATPRGGFAHSRTSSGMDNVHYVQGYGVVQHPFDSQLAEELSVYRGEEVEVEAEVDGWLHCVSSSGRKGLVPATYVRMLAPGEHAPAPASPAARAHSRQPSYDFFSADDPLAAFTKPEAPAKAWTTFEGYDEQNTFGSQPSVEILGETPEEDYEYDDIAGNGQEAGYPEEDYVHVDASEAVSDLDASQNPAASQQDERRLVSRVPSLQNWASGDQLAASSTTDSASAAPDDTHTRGLLPEGVDISSQNSLTEAELQRQVAHGGLLSSVRRMSPHSRTPSIDAGPGSPGSRASRHSRASSFDSAALAGLAPKPRNARALHDFDAETEDELSVGAGEQLVVLAEVEGWLQVHKAGEPDRVGFIPSSYASGPDE